MSVGRRTSDGATDAVFPPVMSTGMCMGSSTNHVVRFDGLALRLDREGLCSYTLLTVSGGRGQTSEVKLHNSPCQLSNAYNQVCMEAMEVTHGPHKLLLKDDMTVRVVFTAGTFNKVPVVNL